MTSSLTPPFASAYGPLRAGGPALGADRVPHLAARVRDGRGRRQRDSAAPIDTGPSPAGRQTAAASTPVPSINVTYSGASQVPAGSAGRSSQLAARPVEHVVHRRVNRLARRHHEQRRAASDRDQRTTDAAGLTVREQTPRDRHDPGHEQARDWQVIEDHVAEARSRRNAPSNSMGYLPHTTAHRESRQCGLVRHLGLGAANVVDMQPAHISVCGCDCAGTLPIW